jgi:dTDP-4-dehydrorhamnose 3,5-epimerase-like enzyme
MVEISALEDTGDKRGFSFSMPSQALDFIGRIADIHLTSARRGAVRGNHYHLHKRQALILFPGPAWSLHWDEGEGTPVQRSSFDGSGAVMVLVSPGCSLAVRNDGEQPLWLVTCSSKPYDPKDIVTRKVI